MTDEQVQQLTQINQYPGMRAEESAVARRWLRKYAAGYDRVEFNVRLGKGMELPAGASELDQRVALALSQKRADLVAFREASVAIVEVKVRISPAVIGQLHVYRDLLTEQLGSGRVLDSWAIGVDIQPDLRPTIERQGIVVELFP
jgi:hypothetical protein